MLKLQDIDITLSKNTKLEQKVLKKLNLTVKKGEFVIIIGGNGAGKSTMFDVISGALRVDYGQVIVDGENITNVAQRYRAAIIAKVMQDPRIGTMENMTIFENMAFALKRGQKKGFLPFFNKARKRLFKEKLEVLNMGLEDRLDELVSNLSGGQRQALSLIMAIISDSKILLLDEITAALDPKIAETVMQLANKIVQESNQTCIAITHNMAHAIKYGDRLLILKNGQFVKEYEHHAKQHLTPVALALEFGEV
jgi:putative ABC transport system ATP-binding protein